MCRAPYICLEKRNLRATSDQQGTATSYPSARLLGGVNIDGEAADSAKVAEVTDM